MGPEQALSPRVTQTDPPCVFCTQTPRAGGHAATLGGIAARGGGGRRGGPTRTRRGRKAEWCGHRPRVGLVRPSTVAVWPRAGHLLSLGHFFICKNQFIVKIEKENAYRASEIAVNVSHYFCVDFKVYFYNLQLTK